MVYRGSEKIIVATIIAPRIVAPIIVGVNNGSSSPK